MSGSISNICPGPEIIDLGRSSVGFATSTRALLDCSWVTKVIGWMADLVTIFVGQPAFCYAWKTCEAVFVQFTWFWLLTACGL